MPSEPIESILKRQYSDEFDKGRRARMEMSYFAYGEVETGAKKLDLWACTKQRWDKYQETGNTEFLQDAANFLMMEFMFPKHPKAHFKPTDGEESPGRTSLHGRVSRDPNVIKHQYKREGD